MAVRVVIGAQWGDEGKGKIVDLLSREADLVIRFQGGANAGHTLEFDDQKVVLHLIPSGVFHGEAACVIGNGVVIDPFALLEEIEMVRLMGVDLTDRLFISSSAHVILPYHKLLDNIKEKLRGENAIGTTGRGIGPAYVSKISRTGIRMGDLMKPDRIGEKVRQNVEDINQALIHVYKEKPIDAEEILTELKRAEKTLRPYITDTVAMAHDALRRNAPILLEGAQGSLLDVDHGTYPYVTSSSPTAGGACTGSGIPPVAITHVMGITKAYSTRVGHGPYPTELNDEHGELLRKHGAEFGATTGRPRRCGWLDLVALKYAVRVNGFNEIALTKLDVLDHFSTIKVCTHYRIGGKIEGNSAEGNGNRGDVRGDVRGGAEGGSERGITDVFPNDLDVLNGVTPVYKEFPGWSTTCRNCKGLDDLPKEARDYIAYLEEEVGVPFRIISTGPNRSETIVRNE